MELNVQVVEKYYTHIVGTIFKLSVTELINLNRNRSENLDGIMSSVKYSAHLMSQINFIQYCQNYRHVFWRNVYQSN